MIGEKVDLERMMLRIKATKGQTSDEYVVLSKHCVPSEILETIISNLDSYDTIVSEDIKSSNLLIIKVEKTIIK